MKVVIVLCLCIGFAFAAPDLNTVLNQIGNFKAHILQVSFNSIYHLIQILEFVDYSVKNTIAEVEVIIQSKTDYWLTDIDEKLIEAANEGHDISSCKNLRTFLQLESNDVESEITENIRSDVENEVNFIKTEINLISGSASITDLIERILDCQETCLANVSDDVQNYDASIPLLIADEVQRLEDKIVGLVDTSTRNSTNLLYNGLKDLQNIYNTTLECIKNLQ